MATIVNEFDLTLTNASTRDVDPRAGKFIILTPSTQTFRVDGANGFPTSITLEALPINIPQGTVVWSTTAGATLTGTGNNRTLTFNNMSVDEVTITVSITDLGETYTTSRTITKVYDGANGVVSYTWIKYGDSAAGAGLSDSPTGKTYIGLAHNKSTATESTNPADYAWSLIKGTDGVQGPAGTSFYTWIKYSDVADGTGLYDIPTDSTTYIGIATNKTTATESTVKTDYVWSKFKGDQGVPGDGNRGAGTYYASGSSWSDTTANDATPGANVIDDTVTISNNTTFIDTRKWNGSAWVGVGTVINGGLIVPGTITANQINTNNLIVRDAVGNPILGAGTALPISYAPTGTLNSNIALSSTGALTGAGGGQIETTPILDRERTTAYPPSYYSTGTTREFKQSDAFGLNALDGFYFTLETHKQFAQGNGGFPGYQYAYQGTKTFRRQATTDAGVAWTAWVQDLDRNAYTGDLNATLGADITNLKAGIGNANVLPNSLPTSLNGFNEGSNHGLPFSFQHHAPGNVSGFAEAYTRNKRGVVFVSITGTPEASSGHDIYKNGESKHTVVAGQRYEVAVDLSAHRCQSYVCLAYYNSSGTYLGEVSGNSVSTAAVTRSVLFFTVPAGATQVMVFARANFTGAQTNPYLFTSEWYLGLAGAAQTTASPYTPSPSEVTYNADLAKATAEAAMLSKLSKTSDDILGSVLSVNVVTAPAGFRAGTLTWNTAGNRTGGYGVAMTPKGLVGYNSSGVLTFYVDAATGSAYFGGELMAVTGSFGSVTIATGGSIRSGQTAYDTGNGFFLGDVAGNPKLSMKTANGAKFLCDPANNILQLTGATINNPTMDTMTVTGFNDIVLSGRPNTSTLTYFGTLTASTAGGVAPYSYTWTLNTAHGSNLTLSAATGASVDVKARSVNNSVDGYAICTSTDSNGRTATRTCYISIAFGAA